MKTPNPDVPEKVKEEMSPALLIDTPLELEAYKQKSENVLMGRKIVVTYLSMGLVAAMAVVANYMPVVKELYSEFTSSIILISLTMISGNVAATFVERKFKA
jgi:hypothetical protein